MNQAAALSVKAGLSTRSEPATPLEKYEQDREKSSVGAPRFELGTSSPPDYAGGCRALPPSGGKWLQPWLCAHSTA